MKYKWEVRFDNSSLAFMATMGFAAGLASALLALRYNPSAGFSVLDGKNNKRSGEVRRAERGERAAAVEGEGMDTPDLPLRVLRKAETVLAKRTTRLVCVIEKTTDVHNYSAVVRTAEALGIQELYLIAPPVTLSADGEAFEPYGGYTGAEANVQNKKHWRKRKVWKADEDKAVRHQGYAKTASKWITTYEFKSTAACIEKLRERGFDIWVTDLSQKAIPLTLNSPNGGELPPKLAIVFGTESTGCTEEMLDAADYRVYLPLSGFADSLNLSVAAAMVIQKLFFLDPSLVGDITEEEKDSLRSVWYPTLARNKTEDKLYRELLAKREFPVPFADVRRADGHRDGWLHKKVKSKANKKYAYLEGKEWEESDAQGDKRDCVKVYQSEGTAFTEHSRKKYSLADIYKAKEN